MTLPADPRTVLRALVAAGERITEALTDLGEIHGYGLLHPEDPRDFTPDENECTPEELANHRAAVEAVERGEPVPDQPFTPDAATFINGEMVHSCGGSVGIGSYVVRDPELIALRDAFDAARPALSALAGMCVLDVETVRVLVGETTRRHINDPFHNIGDLVDCDSCAALAAAEAELRAEEGR